ncbi:MAG: hypothetical protein U0228_11445 [Myxococcaceae bacterium]
MSDVPRCAEHQEEATTTCQRCGAFTCLQCTSKPYCAGCFKLLTDAAGGIPPHAAQPLLQLARYSWGFFALAVLTFKVPFAACFAPVLLLTGFVAGVWSLSRGRTVPGVARSAWAGVILNALGLALLWKLPGFVSGH